MYYRTNLPYKAVSVVYVYIYGWIYAHIPETENIILQYIALPIGISLSF